MPPSAGPIEVILNPRSGAGTTQALADRVLALGRKAEREVRVSLPGSREELRHAVERALEARPAVIAVGGGDGTIGCAAGVLAGGEIPLGVLPLGTLNHFAKDLRIPLEFDGAMAVILGGQAEPIDVGEVNGRVFVNNSSLGLYPLIVRLRREHPVRGPAKWLVAVWATLTEIRRGRPLLLRLEVRGEAVVHRTPILFIANNRYVAGGIATGSRDSLQDGRLGIYIVKEAARRHLLRLAWRVLRNRAKEEELEVLLATSATIEPSRFPVQVAVDGEVEHFDVPLVYRIRPGALRVMVPPAISP